MPVFVAGLWSYSPRATWSRGQSSHILLLYISVEFIHVIVLKHSHHFQVGNWLKCYCHKSIVWSHFSCKRLLKYRKS